MSANHENVSDTNLEKLDEITNKLKRCNKKYQISFIELLEKMRKANETKTEYKIMDEMTHKNKRAVYLTKLNNKEIRQPKIQTISYYKIYCDEETETYS